MDGREFLKVAKEMAAGPTEVHWRSAASRGYYALFLEARETLTRWGVVFPRQQNIHAVVRLKFTFASDRDLKDIGASLDDLVRSRNQADYQMKVPAVFASNAISLQMISEAEAAIALLDAIEADPSRRAAAIATLPP